ncbi:hypothetical protein [Rhodococcus sp. T7]|nr:hypothetical protein [Rhodococcus sp. T7]
MRIVAGRRGDSPVRYTRTISGSLERTWHAAGASRSSSGGF